VEAALPPRLARTKRVVTLPRLYRKKNLAGGQTIGYSFLTSPKERTLSMTHRPRFFASWTMLLPPLAFLRFLAVVILFSPIAHAEFQLTSPRTISIPGVTLNNENHTGMIRGADFDARTGHLWLAGDFLVDDPSEPGEFLSADIVEFDPATHTTLTTLNTRANNALHLGLPTSLAVHPATGNLFVGWYNLVEDRDNHGGFAELTPTGAVVSNPDLGGDFFVPGAAFNPAGKLIMVYAGGTLLQIDSVTRQIESSQTIHDTFAAQNYLAADFDPVTGHLFLAGTTAGIVELDPAAAQSLSIFDESPFLPAPGPLQPIHGRVNAMAFSPLGDQLYIGGDFGLIAFDRPVPEPAAAVCLFLALPLLRRRRQRPS
jgi:hypothetical protein